MKISTRSALPRTSDNEPARLAGPGGPRTNWPKITWHRGGRYPRYLAKLMRKIWENDWWGMIFYMDYIKLGKPVNPIIIYPKITRNIQKRLGSKTSYLGGWWHCVDPTAEMAARSTMSFCRPVRRNHGRFLQLPWFGFLGNGGSPRVGWLISWKLQKMDDLGVHSWLRKPLSKMWSLHGSRSLSRGYLNSVSLW